MDNYNQKSLSNLETWFDLFFRMKYFQKIKIYLDNVDSDNLIYDGLLQDLTYLDIQEISDLKISLIEQDVDYIILVGDK